MSASRMPTFWPAACEPEREVDGDRRLADAALAGGDGDERLDARHLAIGFGPVPGWAAAAGGGAWLWPGVTCMRPRARASPRRGRSLLLAPRGGFRAAAPKRRPACAARRFGRQHGVTPATPGDLGDDRSRPPCAAARAPRRGRRNGDRKIDAVVLDQDLRDEAQVDDIAFEIRPLDAAQLIENLRLRDGH